MTVWQRQRKHRQKEYELYRNKNINVTIFGFTVRGLYECVCILERFRAYFTRASHVFQLSVISRFSSFDVRKITNYVNAHDTDNVPWIVASVLYCRGIVELSTAITVTRPLSGSGRARYKRGYRSGHNSTVLFPRRWSASARSAFSTADRLVNTVCRLCRSAG